MTAPFGFGGVPFGRSGAALGRAPVATPPPPPATGRFPVSLQSEWGLTANTSVTDISTVWNALSGGVQGKQGWTAATSGGRGDLDRIKVSVRWPDLEPHADHVYDFTANAVQAKADWARARGYGVLFLFTFCPPAYTLHPAYTSSSRTTSRIYFASLPSANWKDHTVAGSGIPAATHVTAYGSDGTGDYVVVDKTITAGSSNITVTFGGATGAATEDDRHLWCDPSHYLDMARAVGNICQHFDGYDVAFCFYNEANASGYSSPGLDVNGGPTAYATMCAWVARAVKEWDPSIPVYTTGTANGMATGSFNKAADDFLRGTWRTMKGTGFVWKSWLTSTDPLVAAGLSKHTMSDLHDQGWIDDDFCVDGPGNDQYCQGRSGAGPDNFNHWHNTTGATSAPAVMVTLLNDLHIEDPSTLQVTGAPTAGGITLTVKAGTAVPQTTDPVVWPLTKANLEAKITAKLPSGGTVTARGSGSKWRLYFGGSLASSNIQVQSTNVEVSRAGSTLVGGDFTVAKIGLDRMNVISPETGLAHHPGATTAVGLPSFAGTGSEEEAYVNITSLKRVKAKNLAYPSTGGVPAKLFTGDIRDRIGLWNIQWVKEAGGGDYAHPDVFTNTGFITKEAGFGVPINTLKRAAGTTRPILDSSNGYPDSAWGAGNDGIDAFDHVWSASGLVS